MTGHAVNGSDRRFVLSDCENQGCDSEHTCVANRCVGSTIDEVKSALGASPVDGSKPSVRCGDNGVRSATTGDVCCLSVDANGGKSSGRCRPSFECDAPDIVLNCDDDGDCPAIDGERATRLLSVRYSMEAAAAGMWSKPSQIDLSACVPESTLLGQSSCSVRIESRAGEIRCASQARVFRGRTRFRLFLVFALLPQSLGLARSRPRERRARFGVRANLV